MIFLDTHALVFLGSDHDRIPRAVWAFLDGEELVCSPMSRLELDFLHEIGRLREEPVTVMEILGRDFGVRVENDGWPRATEIASMLAWTRDPFDRLLVAHAMVWGAPLLTKDERILANYRHAFWERLPEGATPPQGP